MHRMLELLFHGYWDQMGNTVKNSVSGKDDAIQRVFRYYFVCKNAINENLWISHEQVV